MLFLALVAVMVILASPLLPTKNFASFYAVVSGSMEPTIPTGAIALVTAADTKDLSSGQIIAFESPNNPQTTIMHRINSVQKSDNSVMYLTKGDNNEAIDSWFISPAQIKGIYQFNIPLVGYAVTWIKAPIGFAIAIGIPALLIAILQIRKIKQGINEEVEKRTRKALQNSDPGSGSSSNTSRLPSIAVAIILSASMIMATASPVQALFSAQVTATGLTLSVADDGSQSHFPCGIVIWKVHWYQINHIYRLAWIELRNINHHHVDLGNWYFDQSWRHKKITFPHHAAIKANSTYTIVNSDWNTIETQDKPAQTDLTLPLDQLNIQATDTTAFTLNQSNHQLVDQMPMPNSQQWHSSHFDQHSHHHFPFWRGWWIRPVLFCGWWNPWPMPTMPDFPPVFPFNTLQATPSPTPVTAAPTATPTPVPTSVAIPTPTPLPTVKSATPSATGVVNLSLP